MIPVKINTKHSRHVFVKSRISNNLFPIEIRVSLHSFIRDQSFNGCSRGRLDGRRHLRILRVLHLPVSCDSIPILKFRRNFLFDISNFFFLLLYSSRDLLYKPIVLREHLSRSLFISFCSVFGRFINLSVIDFIFFFFQLVAIFCVFGVCINQWAWEENRIVQYVETPIIIFQPSVKCFTSCFRRCIPWHIREENRKY